MAGHGKTAGTKAWRAKFDVTGKLGTNLNFSGEEARAIIEFMEQEELPGPAAAVRVLLGAALSNYPEWGANAAARRNVMIEQRAAFLSRATQFCVEYAAELEADIQTSYVQKENETIEAATQAALEE